jgi:hypothetical protein
VSRERRRDAPDDERGVRTRERKRFKVSKCVSFRLLFDALSVIVERYPAFGHRDVIE